VLDAAAEEQQRRFLEVFLGDVDAWTDRRGDGAAAMGAAATGAVTLGTAGEVPPQAATNTAATTASPPMIQALSNALLRLENARL